MSSVEQTAPSEPEGAPIGRPRPVYFRLFTQALNIAGTILILLMAISVNLDVFGRNAFNQPIPGVNEFIGLSIVAVVFLQMANTLAGGPARLERYHHPLDCATRIRACRPRSMPRSI